jgi:hypothetical protein
LVTSWIVEARISPAVVNALENDVLVTVEDGACSVRFQLDADGPLAAMASAAKMFERAGPIVRLVAMTIEEAERELTIPQVPDLVGILDIQEMAGLRTKQRALQVTGLPGFPPPAVKTRAGRLWVRPAVERFLAGWHRRPGRPPTKARAKE